PSHVPLVRDESLSECGCMGDERIALILRRFTRFCCLNRGNAPWVPLDNSSRGWHHGRNLFEQRPKSHEAVFAEILHLVEWPDLWHAAVDLALRRTRRHRRPGQPLLPHSWWRHRSDARLRTALGDL